MNMKHIFTNGTFDILHSGHFCLLSYCRELAGDDGIVIVALDSDEKITLDKGDKRPIFTYEERRDAIQKLNIVDVIVSFNTNEELYDIIKKYKPDTIVKGSDWMNNVIGSDLCDVCFYDRMSDFSSSKIIRRVLEKNRLINV